MGCSLKSCSIVSDHKFHLMRSTYQRFWTECSVVDALGNAFSADMTKFPHTNPLFLYTNNLMTKVTMCTLIIIKSAALITLTCGNVDMKISLDSHIFYFKTITLNFLFFPFLFVLHFLALRLTNQDHPNMLKRYFTRDETMFF